MPELTMSELTELIKKGDVTKIVIINKTEPNSYAEIYIDPKKLSGSSHNGISRSSISNNAGPHYKHKIVFLESFDKKIDEAKIAFLEENPDAKDIPVTADTKGTLTNIIIWLFPFILLIAIWVFFYATRRRWRWRCRWSNIQHWKIQSYTI
jgi:ATP-dependent Zn protease